MVTADTPTSDALIAAAAAIAPRLAANASSSARARCLAPDSVAALREAGLWRLLLPARYGGLEAGPNARQAGMVG